MEVIFYIENNDEIEELTLTMKSDQFALLSNTQGEEIDFLGRSITIFRISYSVEEFETFAFMPQGGNLKARVFASQIHDHENVLESDKRYLEGRKNLLKQINEEEALTRRYQMRIVPGGEG